MLYKTYFSGESTRTVCIVSRQIGCVHMALLAFFISNVLRVNLPNKNGSRLPRSRGGSVLLIMRPIKSNTQLSGAPTILCKMTQVGRHVIGVVRVTISAFTEGI